MKLRIRNFAKISKADIEIDGITIIAGNNNTGKSTVGKILDSVFNSSYNIFNKTLKIPLTFNIFLFLLKIYIHIYSYKLLSFTKL